MPGDTVLVHGGVYREWVRPRRGGVSDARRITYAAAPGERVVVTGSEPVTGWEREVGEVWRADVPNALFGEFNPFRVPVFGDWLVRSAEQGEREGRSLEHLGAVYLDGRGLGEASSRDEVMRPVRHRTVVDDWTQTTVPVEDPEWTARRWFAEAGAERTTIWANFGDADPNARLVEIHVRPAVFFPDRHHVDYVTVRGFELAQAATQWAPPTAEQQGLVGPNWAKGWVIEDNVVHDSKCAGVSLGIVPSAGDNFASTRGDKPGYLYQVESVFSARQAGWDREHVGSHVVRRNRIFDCGQAGIVGHAGCVFSTIEDNDIHHIATAREFFGHEIAGIKLHAAIDVTIRHNRIHHCTLGTWLDWQAQGTRVSRNLYHDNSRDLFVEVSHGPYLVEHNVFTAPAALEIVSEGGAFVHNLVAGTVRLETVMDRPTPYHRPHSTQLAGFSAIPGGDDRWLGNLFVGGDPDRAYGPGFRRKEHDEVHAGTVGYDGYPASFEEYLRGVNALQGDHQRFYGRRLPAYVRHNVYAAGARPFAGETGAAVLDGAATLAIGEDQGAVWLDLTLPEGFAAAGVPASRGADLERCHFPDAEYEEPDGTPAVLDTDLLGEVKPSDGTWVAGPLAGLREGTSRIRVW
jgi:hypothetical protein